ncbi:MAG: hypothetical protein JSV48_12900, partial [Bradyrhizobium sp.]
STWSHPFGRRGPAAGISSSPSWRGRNQRCGARKSPARRSKAQRTELIIFIRPQIIRDGADAHFVAEELRTKLRGTINAVGPKQTAPTTYR